MNRKDGATVAAVLTSAWRRRPEALAVSPEELATVARMLLETGAAGLAYHRLRHHSPLTTHHSPTCHELHQAYRMHTLQAAVQQQHLCELLRRLRTAGIEPLLVKGWSVARLYPEVGLRPAGDIDLCVRPCDLTGAMAVLRQAAGQCGSVDLHDGVADLDRSLDEVVARSRLVPLGGVEVRILGAEDQLRHLCLHLMRHGGWRALWLCDVAAALESLPCGFDWDYCLAGDRWRTEWVRCTIGLAQELLGARLDRPEIVGGPVPRWLIASVLASWGRGGQSNDAIRQPITACLSHWRGLADALRQRWPNPIRAAFKLHAGPRHGSSILFMQIRAFLLRVGQFAAAWPPRPPAGQPFAIHPRQVR